jgi:hypothetical protein
LPRIPHTLKLFKSSTLGLWWTILVYNHTMFHYQSKEEMNVMQDGMIITLHVRPWAYTILSQYTKLATYYKHQASSITLSMRIYSFWPIVSVGQVGFLASNEQLLTSLRMVLMRSRCCGEHSLIFIMFMRRLFASLA